MCPYLLRFEAMNLAGFIQDTQDLATIRGGSLMLLGAAQDFGQLVTRHWKGEVPEFEAISTGASSGLFRFRAQSDEEATAVRHEVARIFRDHPDLGHATFSVDVLPEGDFREAADLLVAMNRWRQFQELTVVVPETPENGKGKPCEIDGIRPGTAGLSDAFVSGSVHRRRTFGREMKRKFYRRELDRAGTAHDPAAYVQDLKSLAARTGHPLDGKLAVIYIDGNRFGRFRVEHCQDAEELGRFDKWIQGERAKMLAALLGRMESDSTWQTSDGARRIETLLWGGDELTWVVPAWKGWEALEVFFSRDWVFDGVHLEHAAGMVFCHDNAHIHRITSLANELAGIAKQDRSRSLAAYQVLESFDHAGADLELYRGQRRPAGATEKDVLLEARQLSETVGVLSRARPAIARTKLYKLVKILLREGGAGEELATQLESQIASSDPGSFEYLAKTFASETTPDGPRLAPAVWVHLLELWDYLPES